MVKTLQGKVLSQYLCPQNITELNKQFCPIPRHSISSIRSLVKLDRELMVVAILMTFHSISSHLVLDADHRRTP